MLATKTRHTDPATKLFTPPSARDETASRIFSALQRLHGLAPDEVDLLARADAGLRFIRSTGVYTELEHNLFRIALAEIGAADAFVVESAACLAADLVPLGDSYGGHFAGPEEWRRALWFAAILRISDAYCGRDLDAPEGVFATWTDRVVYLEFDGVQVSERRLAHTSSRVAALEALTGRSVRIAGSAARRGAA